MRAACFSRGSLNKPPLCKGRWQKSLIFDGGIVVGRKCGQMNRKTVRLQEYNYNTPGVYFLTLCTEKRQCILSLHCKTLSYRNLFLHLSDFATGNTEQIFGKEAPMITSSEIKTILIGTYDISAKIPLVGKKTNTTP